MYRLCGVTFVPPFFMEKLISPGRLLKNGPEASTVSVTGTVIVRPGLEYSTIVISPVYMPAASVVALILTSTGWAGKQREGLFGETKGRFPPCPLRPAEWN